MANFFSPSPVYPLERLIQPKSHPAASLVEKPTIRVYEIALHDREQSANGAFIATSAAGSARLQARQIFTTCLRVIPCASLKCGPIPKQAGR